MSVTTNADLLRAYAFRLRTAPPQHATQIAKQIEQVALNVAILERVFAADHRGEPFGSMFDHGVNTPRRLFLHSPEQ